jgi:two-component system nitrogen regulation response regulator GlnG
MLVQHYLRRFGSELGRDVQEVAPEAMQLLRSNSWPGNIRVLQSVIKQALLQAHGSVLLPSFLPDFVTGSVATAAPAGVNLELETFIRQRLQPDSRDLYAEAHGQLDRFLLSSVLEYTGGSQHQAARLLGIARQTLRLKLRDLGLRVTQSIEVDDDNEP